MTAEMFRKYFDGKFRREGMGVYGMCFFLCAHLNHRLAKENRYAERIAFLMDSGNQYAEHVRVAHAVMQKDWKAMNIGSLTFARDEEWSALQAADVIAWASRVKAQGNSFNNGYEPLDGLFNNAHAQEPPFSEIEIADLAAVLDEFRQGENPSI